MYTLTGSECDKNMFHFYEAREIDFNKVFKVLNGELAGNIYRSAIPSYVCKKIEENFWNSPFRRNRSDEVSALYLGTFHYNKNLDEYLQEAGQYRDKLESLFEGTNHFFNDFINGFKTFLKGKGINFRLAEHFGRQASPFRMSAFPQESPFAVKPHDDLLNLKIRNKRGLKYKMLKNLI